MTDPEPITERFAPTGGKISGVIAVTLAAGVVVVGILDAGSVAPWGFALAVLCGALAWSALLRPRVAVVEGRLVLRGMVDTVVVPLEAIDSVVVRQVLAVLVDGRRYVSAAVGRSLRDLRRESSGGRPPRVSGTTGLFAGPVFEANPMGPGSGSAASARARHSYGHHVQDRLTTLVAEARARAGEGAEAGPVVRRWAWPELAVLVLSAVLTVVLLAAR